MHCAAASQHDVNCCAVDVADGAPDADVSPLMSRTDIQNALEASQKEARNRRYEAELQRQCADKLNQELCKLQKAAADRHTDNGSSCGRTCVASKEGVAGEEDAAVQSNGDSAEQGKGQVCKQSSSSS